METGISVPDTELYIKKYDQQVIELNTEHKQYESFIVSPDYVVNEAWGIASLEELNEDSLLSLFKTPADVYLVGTGAQQRFPSVQLFKFCQQHNKAVDFMSSQAACRTFNLLAAEGRAVVAALIMETRNTAG